MTLSLSGWAKPQNAKIAIALVGVGPPPNLSRQLESERVAVRKTIKNVMMVVPALITSCQVSLKTGRELVGDDYLELPAAHSRRSDVRRAAQLDATGFLGRERRLGAADISRDMK
jgi:hypothetical protein